jgi:hypothetical protein
LFAASVGPLDTRARRQAAIWVRRRVATTFEVVEAVSDPPGYESPGDQSGQVGVDVDVARIRQPGQQVIGEHAVGARAHGFWKPVDEIAVDAVIGVEEWVEQFAAEVEDPIRGGDLGLESVRASR